MFRAWSVALFALLALAGTVPVRAAFTLVGPLSPPGPNTGVSVNPNAPPGTGPGNTVIATGHVSTTSFVTWNGIGPDSVALSSNTLTSVMSPSIAPIAAIYLVSNSTSPTLGVPPTLPLSPTSNMQRSTTGFSYVADFSSNEALLFANAANAALIIDFAVPIKAAGFRVQKNTFDPPGSPDTTFFLQALNANGGGGYSAASGLFANEPVQTSPFAPFSDSAPFYGISGANNSETFTRLWIGFAGPTGGFAISTLEFVQGTGGGGGGTVVPVPPTIFAALFGGLGLTAIRRLRRKA